MFAVLLCLDDGASHIETSDVEDTKTKAIIFSFSSKTGCRMNPAKNQKSKRNVPRFRFKTKMLSKPQQV